MASIRRAIVRYITEVGGSHTNFMLAYTMGYPEPSVRRATREAAARGDLVRVEHPGVRCERAGLLEYRPVSSPAPAQSSQ